MNNRSILNFKTAKLPFPITVRETCSLSPRATLPTLQVTSVSEELVTSHSIPPIKTLTSSALPNPVPKLKSLVKKL